MAVIPGMNKGEFAKRLRQVADWMESDKVEDVELVIQRDIREIPFDNLWARYAPSGYELITLSYRCKEIEGLVIDP